MWSCQGRGLACHHHRWERRMVPMVLVKLHPTNLDCTHGRLCPRYNNNNNNLRGMSRPVLSPWTTLLMMMIVGMDDSHQCMLYCIAGDGWMAVQDAAGPQQQNVYSSLSYLSLCSILSVSFLSCPISHSLFLHLSIRTQQAAVFLN